jgi:hypothetical protein
MLNHDAAMMTILMILAKLMEDLLQNAGLICQLVSMGYYSYPRINL